MLLAAGTIVAGLFVLTISGGCPLHNGLRLLAHSLGLSPAVDDTAAICSIMSFNAVAIFVIVIGLFSAALMTGASSKPEILCWRPAGRKRQAT